MIERLRKALADEEVAAIIRTENNVETLDALLASWPACFTDESEESLATLLRSLPALLDAAEAWRDYLSAQRTIEESGHMDNYTDAARARKRQAKAIDRARRALAALAKEET